MTTAHSPIRQLKAQAAGIAAKLKKAERGEVFPVEDPAGKLAQARADKEQIIFGVAMDDKLIKIAMPWATIRAMTEKALAKYLLEHMRKVQRETLH